MASIHSPRPPIPPSLGINCSIYTSTPQLQLVTLTSNYSQAIFAFFKYSTNLTTGDLQLFSASES